MLLDPAQLSSLMKGLGYFIVTVFSVFGGAQIIVKLVDRYWKKKDAQESGNSEVTIAFLKSLNTRVDSLEAQNADQGEKLLAALVENAELRGKNNLLIEQLATVTKENSELRKKLTTALKRIETLEKNAQKVDQNN